MKKKREWQSSELIRVFSKKYGLEDQLLAFEVRTYLEEYLSPALAVEIECVRFKNGVAEIKINSPLLRNDFHLRKSFYLEKFQNRYGKEKITDLIIL